MLQLLMRIIINSAFCSCVPAANYICLYCIHTARIAGCYPDAIMPLALLYVSVTGGVNFNFTSAPLSQGYVTLCCYMVYILSTLKKQSPWIE